MYELQMMGIMEHDLKGISVPYLSEHQKSIRPQKSSSSLTEKMTSSHEETTTYLSRSANISTSIRRSSFLAANSEITSSYSRRAYEAYDTSLFKSTPEPRFYKKPVSATKMIKAFHNAKSPEDSPEKLENTNEFWKNASSRHKSTTVKKKKSLNETDKIYTISLDRLGITLENSVVYLLLSHNRWVPKVLWIEKKN
jgi:hypothetical protein